MLALRAFVALDKSTGPDLSRAEAIQLVDGLLRIAVSEVKAAGGEPNRLMKRVRHLLTGKL